MYEMIKLIYNPLFYILNLWTNCSSKEQSLYFAISEWITYPSIKTKILLLVFRTDSTEYYNLKPIDTFLFFGTEWCSIIVDSAHGVKEKSLIEASAVWLLVDEFSWRIASKSYYLIKYKKVRYINKI